MLIPSIQEKKSWLGILIFLAICLNLYFDFTFEGGLEQRRTWLDNTFKIIFMPVEFVASSAQEGTKNLQESFVDLVRAHQMNDRLREEASRLELRLYDYQELKSENERLRELLGFKESQPHDYLAAEVIGKDPHPFYQTLLLDRGEKDGVRVGMPVVSTQGVVGRIIEVGEWSSQVHLITDSNARVDAVVQRSRTRAIVAGSLEGTSLHLRFLPRRQDIREGDILLTSGLGRNFPAGFMIGKVKEVSENANEVLGEAVIEASVDFNAVEEVFIVRSFLGEKS